MSKRTILSEPLTSLLPLNKPGPGLLGPIPLIPQRSSFMTKLIKSLHGDGLLGPAPMFLGENVLAPQGGLINERTPASNPLLGPSGRAKVFDIDSRRDRPGWSTMDDCSGPSFARGIYEPRDSSTNLRPMFDTPGCSDGMSDVSGAMFDRFDSRHGNSRSFESRHNDQETFGSRFDGSRHNRQQFKNSSRATFGFDDLNRFDSPDNYERRLGEQTRFGSMSDRPRRFVDRGSSDFGMGPVAASMRNLPSSDRISFDESSVGNRMYSWSEVMEWENDELGFSEREPTHIRDAYEAAHQIAMRNPIVMLKEFCQWRNWPTPTYHLVMDGKNSLFQFKVKVNGEWHDVGRYSFSEKQAKIYAAIRALYNLRELF